MADTERMVVRIQSNLSNLVALSEIFLIHIPIEPLLKLIIEPLCVVDKHFNVILAILEEFNF